MGIRGFLVAELDAMYFCPQVVMNFRQCFRHRTRLLIFCLVGWGGRKVELPARVVAEVRKERRYSRHFQVMVIRCEFGNRQPVSPIILQVVNVRPQVLFHYRVHSFGLTIGLWMECGRQLRFNFQSCTETMPEWGGKLRPSV